MPSALRIVVVDDDTPTSELLCDLLSEEGYQVHCCRKDANALAVIRTDRPDLVILDFWLTHPGREWTILRAIRHDPLLLTVPVIVCTTDCPYRAGLAEELRQLSCVVVLKPFEIDELCAKVKMMIRTASIQ
jgi:DNA-binding response OmpR family regulator